MNPLFLDIETTSVDRAADFLDPVEAPSNYKDPAKIADYIETKTRERLEKAARDPDLARIVCIGIGFQADQPVTFVARDEDDERYALDKFWHVAGDPLWTLVGFGVLRFDLPVLLRRSQLLGVPYPKLQVERYRHARIVDLEQELTFNGLTGFPKSLDAYCRLFGVETTPDDVTGEMVPGLAKAGEWDRIQLHCHADILRLRGLAVRVGLAYNAESVPA